MNDPLILLVEDNPDDEELTRLALAKCGIAHDLMVCRDGAAALAWLFEGVAGFDPASRPKVILLDLKLPKVEGLDVLRRLRRDLRTKLIPVVVLTTSLEERDVVASYGAGANCYIRKPVDFDQFAEVIRHIARFWLALNEGPIHPRRNG